MPITVNNSPSFGAIRVPLKYGTQKNIEQAKKVADKVFFKYNANGSSAYDYRAMFFKNKELEDSAEAVLKFHGINYTKSGRVEEASINERNFWAINGRFPTSEELKEYTSDLIRNVNHY